MNKAVKKYIRRVRASVVCSGQQRAKLVADLKERVGQFITEKPEVDYADICKKFGAPEQIAAQFLEEMEPSELCASIRRSSAVRRITAIISVIILSIWFCGVCWGFNEIRKDKNMYFETVLTISTETEEDTEMSGETVTCQS